MSKKIGIFLMIILVLWSFLLLDATKNRKAPLPADPPRESAEAPVESGSAQLPQSENETPATEPGKPSIYSEVEAVLARNSLNRTAATHLVCSGAPAESATAVLAELAAQKEMNPIAAFWLLVSEGLYERGAKHSGLPPVSLPQPPAHSVKQYGYTDAGTQQLLTDLLTLAAQMDNTMAILGDDGAIEPGQVHHALEDGCRYAYFACTTDETASILCFYLRADDRGEWITDVEFQLLHMTGSAAVQTDAQAVTLAAAAELLMTGTVRAGGEATAESYAVGGFNAEAERFFFTAETEEGSLTNYRLRK